MLSSGVHLAQLLHLHNVRQRLLPLHVLIEWSNKVSSALLLAQKVNITRLMMLAITSLAKTLHFIMFISEVIDCLLAAKPL